MSELSESTWEKVRALFPPAQHQAVADILLSECGNNLPYLENVDKEGLERYRFAALKLSNGSLTRLREAIELAKSDWRDLLVAAGFATSADAHKRWRLSKPK